MERTAVKYLEQWMNDPHRKPMIVWGARQVGKTYLIKDLFAKKYFPGRTVYIDLRVEQEIAAYCSTTVSPKNIMEFISLSKNCRIDSSTLLVFDEVQECPAVLTSLKYFCQDYREIPVIVTGSMVRVRIQRKERSAHGGEFLFPVGKINQMTLFPMTFDEFLLNYNRQLYDRIVSAYREMVPVDPGIHELAMNTLYKYLMIGGMPEAIEMYLETDNLADARNVLKDLYDNYLADMELYQASPESVIRSKRVFSNIYKELNRESKNFSPGLIEEKKKNRDFRAPIDWLVTAKVILQSFQIRDHVSLPLTEDGDGLFRLYLSDIGMFSYQSGINPSAFLSVEGKNSLAGIFFENYAAAELAAKGIDLFYWRSKNDAEMEFIVESGNVVIPIDIKRGRSSLNSLEKFRAQNKLGPAIKVSGNNFGYNAEKQLMTVPLYAFFMAAADLAAGTFSVPGAAPTDDSSRA